MNPSNHASARNEACPVCDPAAFDASLKATPFPVACPIHRLHPGAQAFRLRPVLEDYYHEAGTLGRRLAVQGSVTGL